MKGNLFNLMIERIWDVLMHAQEEESVQLTVQRLALH